MSAPAGTAAPPVVAEVFRTLFDDAALFPPGDAPLPQAVHAHRALLSHPDGAYVGPFLVPGGRLAELAAALPDGAAGFGIGLIEPDPGALARRVDEARGDGRVVLRAVEVAGRDGAAEAVRALTAALPAGVVGCVELAYGARSDAEVAVVAAGSLRVKLRTGGLQAQAFPDEDELAAAIAACVRHRVPFKLTAGLHGALRHRDPATGFEHHGVLNVLAATAAALEGRPEPALAALLAERDPERLAAAVERGGGRVRTALTGIGTCSITEPLTELRALGLVPALPA